MMRFGSISISNIAAAAILEICKLKNATTFIQCYHAEMSSRGPEDSKNVKTSQAYYFKRFISFFEDFSDYYRSRIIGIKYGSDNIHK